METHSLIVCVYFYEDRLWKNLLSREKCQFECNPIFLRGGGRTLGDLLDLVYPIGSIYMNVNNVSPQDIFGGQWEKVEGRFLLGSSSTYTLGEVDGEATHTLTVDEMPSHNHIINYDQIWSYGGTTSLGVTSGGPYPGVGYVRNTGGGKAHNNMPPYLVINIWKRIA